MEEAVIASNQPRIPGKLLVLDDKFDSVQALLTELVRNGVPVVFWNPTTNIKPSTTNVRIILTDINLLGLETVTTGSYEDLAAKLKDIPGPFLVMFVSVNFDKDDSANMLREAYYNVTNKDLPGIVLGVNFDKTQTRETLAEIPGKIRAVLLSQRLFSIILLSETILNQGTDRMLGELTRKEFEAAVQALLNSIIEDTGKESVAREFVVLLSRLLTRNMESSPQYGQLKAAIDDLLRRESPPTTRASESWIYNKRMYYVPDENEIFWTGDIFRTNCGLPYQYAILITPSCDISQKKFTNYTFCYGLVTSEKNIKENDSDPVFIFDQSLNGNKENAIKKYIRKENSPIKVYILNHFLEDSEDDTRTLIIDFQSVYSFTKENIAERKWKRAIRLDSPFIEDLLQKYGAYSFRLGVPTVTINKK